MSLYTINKYFGFSVFESEDTDKHIIFKPSYGIANTYIKVIPVLTKEANRLHSPKISIKDLTFTGFI